ncbi:MAG: prolyl oligopeptidase family serine peptidase [Acidobacteriota bacterium]|nr:prolyl oligopeptidase family serine peptidase [Acidobacteriota bacterium]
MRLPRILTLALVLFGLLLQLPQPARAAGEDDRVAKLERAVESLSFELDQVRKAVDDVFWFQRLGDVAEVDKVTYVGPPNPRGEETYGIANERHPFKVHQYVFVPKGLDRARRHPLIVLPHGGVHGDFGTYHVHIVREMVARGWVVIAPEYRGSTGYGRGFYEAIDYGGLEVDDVVAGRDWAVETLPFVDGKRVAIVGWSHGGMIALLAVFDHPEKFAAAYAGVPVSDLLTRLGYLTEEYKGYFSAAHHIGKSPYEAVDEYRRRSPVFHAEKLQTPLLVHATTNDRDVNIVEVEGLIRALTAAGKKFESKIYQDAPGGHSFNRIDTPYARESREEIYRFLERYLGR